MMTSLIIILIVLGLALILLELFVTPGFITGLLGGAAWLYALYKIYTLYGTSSGHLALLGLLLLLIASIIVALKSGIWNRASLKENIDGKVNNLPPVNVGDKGYTTSFIRPMGQAIVNNYDIEVSSMGEMIPSGTNIEIIKIENTKIYIKQTTI
jgi:membrane-bound serine protease (ClpP class)